MTEIRPQTILRVEVQGDTATIEVSAEPGSEPAPILVAAKELVQVLAEKRLAWWHPLGEERSD